MSTLCRVRVAHHGKYTSSPLLRSKCTLDCLIKICLKNLVLTTNIYNSKQTDNIKLMQEFRSHHFRNFISFGWKFSNSTEVQSFLDFLSCIFFLSSLCAQPQCCLIYPWLYAFMSECGGQITFLSIKNIKFMLLNSSQKIHNYSYF